METKKRSVILSCGFNLISATVGHVYIGRPLRGLSIILSGFLVLMLFGWAGASTTLWSFYAAQSTYIAIYLILIIDGGVLAYKRKGYTLKRYNKWYIYFILILMVIFLNSLLFSYRGLVFGFDNHRVVSMNMAPLMKTGDFIATDTRNCLFGNNPNRGDIISFLYPKDPSVIYIKRVIALPGEKVFIKDGRLYINGSVIDEPYVPNTSNIKYYSQDMYEILIPDNHLFVLGDNRDNSNDSRFWGFLPIENVVGRVTLIWYSKDFSRIGNI